MNILLDAYFDLNYGDDLFIETITGMFPTYKFYSFLEYYPPRVIEWAKKIPNLFLLPECDVFLEKNMFDAYICVGGDVFPDNGDFTKRKKYVKSVKEINGTVAFWGFSLFHSYSEQTQADLVEMLQGADIIAPRDERSAAFLNELLPEKEIVPVADLAFLSQWSGKRPESPSGVLGLSVRRPIYATDADMLSYTANLQNAINAYLSGGSERTVTLFSLSSGGTADSEVAQQILDGVAEKDRVTHTVYEGDTAAIKAGIANCDLMICTRLHAMISCIAMGVPFLPVIYEVKMEHVLADIGYGQEKIYFSDTAALPAALQAIGAGCGWESSAVQTLVARTAAVKERLQGLLVDKNGQTVIEKKAAGGPECREKQAWIAAFNQRTAEVDALNAQLQEVRTNPLHRIAGKATKIYRGLK